MARELAVVHWYVDGCHASAEDPHKSHSNASCARDAVQAICESWWPSGGDYAMSFDVVILKPTEWVGRYPVEVETVPRFVVGKPQEAPVRTYKLRRYGRKGLMAEGAEVRASSDEEAIAKARALFHEPEYRHDRFEIEASD